ncbi:vegetative cell wall protein gp1-like isoform X1 [Oncorhynchus tshawytscha]|uniref:vegetative cell wall protein gp1-like isoform X1 n=1 Tax=Oncorhynchus tshawytscha TaxID=74940 RepID=UPI001C3E6144|nr:vegetative cell wall protein gp1-like isoform X1 [Oncorhynchus tshawytscha]
MFSTGHVGCGKCVSSSGKCTECKASEKRCSGGANEKACPLQREEGACEGERKEGKGEEGGVQGWAVPARGSAPGPSAAGPSCHNQSQGNNASGPAPIHQSDSLHHEAAGPQVEPVVRAPKDKPAPASKTRSNAKQSAAPPVGRGRNTRGNAMSNKQAAVKVDKPLEEPRAASPTPPSAEEQKDVKMVKDLVHPGPEPVSAQADCIPPSARTLSSFTPKGFVFQAPAGLSSFNPNPLTPRSADSFFKPSVSVLHLVPLWPSDNLVPKMELIALSPAKSPAHSPPRPSPTPRCLPSPKEPEHDVPYFRSVVVSETEADRILSAVGAQGG